MGIQSQGGPRCRQFFKKFTFDLPWIHFLKTLFRKKVHSSQKNFLRLFLVICIFLAKSSLITPIFNHSPQLFLFSVSFFSFFILLYIFYTIPSPYQDPV